ncbi:MAG: hypothetical protein JWO03_4121 [Bacteroidetes bacterium]|nr:hypothetical protein [Bacteroidota bacterium]
MRLLLIILLVPNLIIAQQLSNDSLIVKHTLQKVLPETDLKKTSSSLLGKLPVSKDTFRKKKIPFHGSVLLQSQYIYTPEAPLSSGGFYTTIGVNAKTEIFKLPLSMGVQVTMHDKQIRADYTTFNVSFDANGYKDKLKSDYLSRISSLPTYFGNEMGAQLSHFEDSLKDYEKYKNILSKSDYYSQLNGYSQQLKTVEDSLAKDSTSTTLKEDYKYLNDTIGKLKGIAEKYSNMESYRRQYPDYVKKLDSYYQYIDKIKNTSDITSIAGIQDSLKNVGLLTRANRILSGIQGFGIGRVSLNLSRYTVQSQSIYGFNVDYLWRKAIYTGIGAGFAAPYSYQFAPAAFISDNPLAKFNFHRIMMYARVGYGPARGDHIHLIWMSYMDRFTAPPATIVSPVSPPANSVLSLEAQQKISRILTFNGEVAVSNSSFLHRSASFVPFSIHSFNFAALLALKGSIIRTHTNFGIKGEVVSGDFNTVGNLFLRRDIASYTADLRQSLFRSRVTFTTMLNHSFQGFDGHSTRLQYLTLANALSTHMSFATYTISYMLAEQMPYGHSSSPFTSASHSLSLIQQYPYSAGRVRFMTSLTNTYFQTRTIGPEFGSYTFSLQNGLQQDITFAKGTIWRIGAGSTYMRYVGNSPAAPGYWAETGNTFAVKKILSLTYMARYTHDGLTADNIRGTASLTLTIYKGLKFMGRASVSKSLGNSQYPSYNNINATAGLNYAW